MEQLLADRACPLCGKGLVEVLFRQTLVVPKEIPLEARQTIVSCAFCGFVYADVPAKQTLFDLYYSQFSKYSHTLTYMGGGGSSDLRRLYQTAEFLAMICPDRNTRILDVGCANGTLLIVLKDLGYEFLFGLDPSPTCVDHVKSNPGIDAFCGSLTTLPKGLGQYDLVVLTHVLEHIRDIRQALLEIRQLLNPSGYVYIEVPDASRYAESVLSPFQEFNLEHIDHFSRQSLEQLLSICGFDVIKYGETMFESAPGIFSPAIFVIGKKRNRINLEIKSDLKMNASLVESIINYIDISQQMLNNIDAKLQKILNEYPRVIVWGTGQLVMKLLAETVLGEADVVAYVDSNPIFQGQLLNNIPILAPTQISSFSEPIIISSTLYFNDIFSFITDKIKLPNLVFGLL